MKRVTKRQQYINSLEHDIQYFTDCIESSKYFHWFMGTMYSKIRLRIMRIDLQTELNKVLTDKTYKPDVLI